MNIKPPENLEGEALLEWQRIVAEMDAAGTLDRKYRRLILRYCQPWAVAQESHKYVVQLGPVVKSFGQVRASPFYRVWREATATCNALLVNLGLVGFLGHSPCLT